MIRSFAIVSVLMVASADWADAQWTLDRDLNPMTDAVRSIASARSYSGEATVHVSCDDDLADPNFNIFLTFNRNMGVRARDIALRYRIDQEPASSWIWVNPIRGGRAIWVRDDWKWQLLKGLMRGGKVTFEVQDYNRVSHYLRFGLQGSSRAIESLGDCITPPTFYSMHFHEADPVDTDPRSAHDQVVSFGCKGGETLYIGTYHYPWVEISAGDVSVLISGEPGAGTVGEEAEAVVGLLLDGQPIPVEWRSNVRHSDTLNLSGEHSEAVHEVVDQCFLPDD